METLVKCFENLKINKNEPIDTQIDDLIENFNTFKLENINDKECVNIDYICGKLKDLTLEFPEDEYIKYMHCVFLILRSKEKCTDKIRKYFYDKFKRNKPIKMTKRSRVKKDKIILSEIIVS